MTIQHGTAHTSYSTKAPGCDLRDTAVGGAIRHGNPEAVARFREILAARDVVKASPPKVTEEKPMETTTVAANGAAEIVDDSASREFEQARKRPADPRPVTIEQTKRKPRKKQVKLTDDQVRAANREYWNGNETFAEICRRYNTSDAALRNRWKKLGLKTPGRGANFLRRQPQAAVALAPVPQPETATVPAAAAEFLGDDLMSRLHAFRRDMEAIGVETSVHLSLHLVKEVRL